MSQFNSVTLKTAMTGRTLEELSAGAYFPFFFNKGLCFYFPCKGCLFFNLEQCKGEKDELCALKSLNTRERKGDHYVSS